MDAAREEVRLLWLRPHRPAGWPSPNNRVTANHVSPKYIYDGRGNLVLEEYGKNKKLETVGKYTYDETNKMVQGVNASGESSSYLYNGLGALVENTWVIAKNSYGYHDVDATAEAAQPDVEQPGIMPLSNGNGGGKGNGQGNGNGKGDKPTGSDVRKTSTVVKQFVVDYTSATFEPLTEHEVNGLDYRYVYGNDRLSVNITGVETSSGNLIENGDQIRLYYHMDLLGTTDYLTSPVSQKVTSWTHYNEWGEITHNAVLKSGKRELDLVKRYATHDYDAVLNMYYAKARMYDAENRRFAAMDPVKGRITEPMTMVQYLYVVDNPLRYIDPTGEEPIALIVYIGDIAFVISYSAWVAWVNTPDGQDAMANATQVVIDGVAYSWDGIKEFFVPNITSAGSSITQISDSTAQIVQQSAQTIENCRDIVISYFEEPICDEVKESDEKQGDIGSKKGADEGTAPSYEEAKKSGKKAPDNKEVTKKRGNTSLPRESTPNSSTDLKDGDKVIQRRYYGSDGKAEYDIDYTDHGNPARHPNVPHGHQWRWDIDSNNPPRPQVPFPFP